MSDRMTRLMVVFSLSFVGLGLTHPSGTPVHAAQNSLPRVFQGQFFYFAINACFLGVNQQIVEYIRYGRRKWHHKPQHPIVRLVRWFLCLPNGENHARVFVNTARESRFREIPRRGDLANRPHSSSDGGYPIGVKYTSHSEVYFTNFRNRYFMP